MSEMGADRALPTAHDVMMEVYPTVDATDRVALHAAIMARRDWHDRASQLLTQLADVVRAGLVEELGSQRAAADELGVKRRTVRPRGGSNGKAKQ